MKRVKEHCEKLASESGVIITEAQLSRILQKEIDRLTAEPKHAESTPHFVKLIKGLLEEIDRLTAKNTELIKALEGCSRCKDQYEAEIKAKDELLNKLAGYTAQNLNQEVLVRLIKQALKGTP